MIAEVIGLAGAGKSSLRRTLQQQGVSTFTRGLSIRNPQNIPYFVGTGVQVFPMLVRSPLRGRWYSRAEIARLFYLTGMRSRFAEQADAEGSLLIDQGPIFELATLHAFGPERLQAAQNRWWWQMMFKEWAATLDLIVWLDAPKEILSQRIRSRPKWHAVKVSPPEEMHEYLEQYQCAYEHVVAELKKVCPITILSFDTSRYRPEEIASDILYTIGHNVSKERLDQTKEQVA